MQPRKRSMKSPTLPGTLLFVCAALLQGGCATDPNDDIDLVITNGYYTLTGNTATRNTYFASFDYSVEGTTCYIEGYSMTLTDSITATVSWDLWKELVPGHVYTQAETIRTPLTLSNPTVTVQGYTEGKSFADPRLKGRGTLVLR